MSPLIQGEQIGLRQIEDQDLAACTGFPYSLSSVKPLVDLPRLRRELARTGFWSEDEGALATVRLDTGRLLGSVQFRRSSPVIHGFEIGYLLHAPADRGLGHGAEALRLISRLLFAVRPSCQRLQLVIQVTNIASWRTAERCGYRREGVLRRAGLDPKDPEDCYLYARVREDALGD